MGEAADGAILDTRPTAKGKPADAFFGRYFLPLDSRTFWKVSGTLRTASTASRVWLTVPTIRPRASSVRSSGVGGAVPAAGDGAGAVPGAGGAGGGPGGSALAVTLGDLPERWRC